MARPLKEIDMPQLAALMRFKPTLEDCAAFFKVSPDTIERRIRETEDLSFAEFRDQNMVHTRFNLVQQALKKATQGDNTMLIFCLKNFCGWSDKQLGDGPDTQINVQTNVISAPQIDVQERIKLIKESVE